MIGRWPHAAEAVAVAAALGAWLVVPVPRPLAAVLVAGALLVRSLPLLLAGVLLGVGALAAAALAPLGVATSGPVEGTVVVVGSPRSFGSGAAVDVRLGSGERVELVGHGRAGRRLGAAALGDRLTIHGVRRPVDPAERRWTMPRHVAGSVEVEHVIERRPGRGVFALANGIHGLLDRGARSLDDDRRALFLGMTIGDDAGQTDAQRAAFRASGLQHLLVVSGANVAFLLAAAHPLLSRASGPVRLVAVVGLLVVFAVVTRMEPSVLRAVAMATVATWSSVSGRPTDGVRRLALAVTALLVVDPLLIRSAGFQLSVAASAGILLLAGPLGRRLPGPGPLRAALSTTVAAQVGVFPVAALRFDGVPVVSIVANLAAGPAAGPVMVWGSTAGLAAGVLPDPVAALIHVPTGLLVGWVDAVARTTAAWDGPVIDPW